jgi:hypothetical protein
MSPDAPSPARIGVIVPCRDEARVLARKLKNLARCGWPEHGGRAPHVVCIVDDGSRDGTAQLARAIAPDPAAPFELLVLSNVRAPGKAGAIETALDAFASCAPPVDLCVLTDADVVVRPDALLALAAAFQREPGLAMACGAQELVRDLADDGTCRGADGAEPVPAAGRYDRWTARVRALESRAGRLFSVHGQLLAWRAELMLRPTPGVAADDLDLMLQARARGGRVRLVASARFLERKTPSGAARDGQAMRRARAYFQVMRRARAHLPVTARARGRGALDRAQLALYRMLPAAAPWLALGGALMLPAAAGRIGGADWCVAALAVLALGAALPAGRRLARLLGVIARAWWRERRDSITDRWEMERT